MVDGEGVEERAARRVAEAAAHHALLEGVKHRAPAARHRGRARRAADGGSDAPAAAAARRPVGEARGGRRRRWRGRLALSHAARRTSSAGGRSGSSAHWVKVASPYDQTLTESTSHERHRVEVTLRAEGGGGRRRRRRRTRRGGRRGRRIAGGAGVAGCA